MAQFGNGRDPLRGTWQHYRLAMNRLHATLGLGCCSQVESPDAALCTQHFTPVWQRCQL